MERCCPPGTVRFVPANKISPKLKRVHESFLSPKLFSPKVKRFFVISPSLWSQKTGKPKASTRMKTKMMSLEKYVLQEKLANVKVKTQSDMKAWERF